MSILMVYLAMGFLVSFLVCARLEREHVTGDQVLSYMDDDMRVWCENHPKGYKAIVMTALFVIVLIWPYALYRLFNDNNDTTNGYTV